MKKNSSNYFGLISTKLINYVKYKYAKEVYGEANSGAIGIIDAQLSFNHSNVVLFLSADIVDGLKILGLTSSKTLVSDEGSCFWNVASSLQQPLE